MRVASTASGLAVLVASTAMAGSVTRVDFDSFDAGRPPLGFTTALTGGGGPVIWTVQEDATAPSAGKVLLQSSQDATGARFSLSSTSRTRLSRVPVRLGSGRGPTASPPSTT